MARMQPAPDFILRGHNDSINCVKFLSSKLLATGSGNGVVKMWNLETRRTVGEYKTCKSVLSLDYIRSLNQFAMLSRDGIVRVWDISNESSSDPVVSFQCGSEHFCNTCTDSSQMDSNTIITPALNESMICLWDIRTPQSPVSVVLNPREKGMVTKLHYNSSFRPDIGSSNSSRVEEDSFLVRQCEDESGLNHSVCGNGYSHGAHDPELVEHIASSKTSTDDDRGEAIGGYAGLSSGLGLFAAGFENGGVSCFERRMNCRTLSECMVHSEPIMALSSSLTSASILTGSADNTLNMFHKVNIYCNAGEPFLVKPRRSLLAKPGTGCAMFRGDGRICVSGHWDGSTRIFSTKKMKPLAIMRHHQDSVYAVDFAPSECGEVCLSGVFATGSKDCTIAVWSVYAESLSSPFKNEESEDMATKDAII